MSSRQHAQQDEDSNEISFTIGFLVARRDRRVAVENGDVAVWSSNNTYDRIHSENW